jgi:alpha-tubulin suppressor-like RCC1 family protein
MAFRLRAAHNVSGMQLGKPSNRAVKSRTVMRRSRSAGRGLGAMIALALLAAACSASSATGQVTSTDQMAGAAGTTPATSTLRHWGSFFDNISPDADTLARPATITVPGTVKQVGSSNSSEYALTTSGTLWAWGLGAQGELGNGQLTSSFTKPVKVAFPPGVKIAWIPTDVMPYDTALAVDTHGNVWGWGANAIGELCLGNDDMQPVPVQLPFSDVTAVSGAADHDLYDAGGIVWSCGQNVDGDLGDGTTTDSATPVHVVGLDGNKVVRLVTSFANSGALMSDGTYYDWGYNDDGQLGDGLPGTSSDVPVLVHLRSAVKQVALGGSLWGNGETLVLLADGSLWSWGSNFAYQLGTGSRAWQGVPVQFRAPKGVTYKLLADGSATSYAVSTAGGVYAWGVNHVGQVGDGSLLAARVPVLITTGASMISSTANNVVVYIPKKG